MRIKVRQVLGLYGPAGWQVICWTDDDNWYELTWCPTWEGAVEWGFAAAHQF